MQIKGNGKSLAGPPFPCEEHDRPFGQPLKIVALSGWAKDVELNHDPWIKPQINNPLRHRCAYKPLLQRTNKPQTYISWLFRRLSIFTVRGVTFALGTTLLQTNMQVRICTLHDGCPVSGVLTDNSSASTIAISWLYRQSWTNPICRLFRHCIKICTCSTVDLYSCSRHYSQSIPKVRFRVHQCLPAGSRSDRPSPSYSIHQTPLGIGVTVRFKLENGRSRSPSRALRLHRAIACGSRCSAPLCIDVWVDLNTLISSHLPVCFKSYAGQDLHLT